MSKLLSSFLVLFGAVCIAQAAEVLKDGVCKDRNAYYAVENQCDSYVECKEYKASEMLCPDGLHFNPRAVWPEYPCSYPTEVSCEGRGKPQPAQPNADCPHKNGFFPSPYAAEGNCGQYRMCVDGMAIEMVCPPGLAFNHEYARCDWPDLVPSCDAEKFLGFKCQLDDNGQPLDVLYSYEGECSMFYVCKSGHLRLLSCDPGYAFDAKTGSCVDAKLVPECAAETKSAVYKRSPNDPITDLTASLLG